MRLSNEKKLTLDIIQKDVSFGSFDAENGNLLKGLEYYLTKITLPSLQATDVRIMLKLFVL